MSKLDEIEARVKQVCQISKTDGLNGIVYCPEPFEYAPKEIRKMAEALSEQVRDSEQNRLFAVLRHLEVKHDAKEIMRVRDGWDDTVHKLLGSSETEGVK